MVDTSIRIDDKVVIVTGASGGIGKATASELAQRGARVILACRNLLAGQRARDEIIAVTGNSNVDVKHLDLASLQSVRQFANDIVQCESRVDILVNNAGVFTREERRSVEGFELHFAVNHLGHFLLTYLLLDKLIASAPSRIVTVSSKGHEFAKLDLDDLQTKRQWSPVKAYSRSKTANVLFSSHLARLLKGTGVRTYCVHPGVVQTDLAREFEGTLAIRCFRCLWTCFCGRLMTSTEGAQTSLYCCLEPSIANVSGQYYSNCRQKSAKSHATSSVVGEKLWRLSSELCHVPSSPFSSTTELAHYSLVL